MTKEGVLRDYYLYRGERHDFEIWAVLAPRWRAARQAVTRVAFAARGAGAAAVQ